MLDKNNGNERRLADLEEVATYRLARLQARLNAHAVALLRKHSVLSLTHWRLLTSINTLVETNLAELVREMQFDKAQLSRGLKSMASLGLVEAVGNPTDNRKQIIRLTVAGKAEHSRLLPVMRARQGVLMEEVSEAQKELFFEILDKFNEALDRAEAYTYE